ncbi:MAG TPA: DNA polymerase III subunit gamma/tau [Anaerolineaceae bacterium]|jgi:DNA polymerase-3 subunit gamma/tau|nr:DNA polymerase III subunit gamma/tau [Anaerolineaceae bacterium]NMC18333.1 DNA polymerase III subunit gamma/tau [Chloroflexota bacterium]HNS06440.1 DNA polymerase III subunit gamma/tau [Anaerolineaceae bacterium]HNW13416.1 DNA polymerase III subunit gamma/tau [Anaerolineaceae bacterium]HOE02079.1 DNA polymerase III subunit gamma/tau [Anaerolineaceae bacterium]
MTQAFYRKWRPRRWDQVVAQDHVVQTLKNAIKADRVGHAYLFSGPRGTGKTTTARLLAKAVNCLNENPAERPCDSCSHCLAVNENRFLDLIEIDAASNTSVEDVRDLRDRINYSPTDGKYKVYIIDEVHMLSTAAFNALLKTLEEPPPHAIFILATTEVHKIPATVLSRCQRHEFRRIPVAETVKALREICKEEQIETDEEALLLIARQSTGALRDAISLLDQLASTGKHIDLALAQTVLGTATNQLVFDLIEGLLKNDPALGMQTIHKALDGGSDPRQYARQVVEYLRNLLLMKMGNEKEIEATREVKNRIREHSDRVEIDALMEWIGLFNAAVSDLRTTWQPSLALEVAFVRALNPAGAERVPVLETGTEKQQSRSTPAAEKIATREMAAAEKKAEKKNEPPAAEEVADTPAPLPEEPAARVQIEQPGKVHGKEMAGAGSAELTTQDLLASWSAIRAEVKLRRIQAEALLNSQKLLQVKNGILVLGFPSEVLRSKMEIPENIEVTRRVIQNLLQVDLPIQCVLVTEKGAISSSNDSEPNGLVDAAINLGGKLIHKD